MDIPQYFWHIQHINRNIRHCLPDQLAINPKWLYPQLTPQGASYHQSLMQEQHIKKILDLKEFDTQMGPQGHIYTNKDIIFNVNT